MTLQKLIDRFFGEVTTGTDSVENGLNWQRSSDTAGWMVDRRYSGELVELFKPPVQVSTSNSSSGSSSSNNSSHYSHPQSSSSSLSSSTQPSTTTTTTVNTNGIATNLTLFKVFSEKNEKGISWLMKASNFPKKVQFFFRDVLTRRFSDEQMESFYPSFHTDNHPLLYQRLLALPLSEQRFINNKLKEIGTQNRKIGLQIRPSCCC